MNKTYLEMACDIVTAMINRNQLRVAIPKGSDWKAFNRESAHTIGWAILEMYKEIKNVPEKAKLPAKKVAAPRVNVKAVKQPQESR